ncbi:hypothetical protein P9W99_16730 [Bacillus cereus]|uniref:Uncharacterized protein n=2 Tax=Bacillus cereus group TaxID=86661 RepID=A0A9W5QFJ2_BACCE|nr:MULTISPECIES: hypothetical protein [Bacillus]AIE37022.1 hypothetical protein BTK_33486 [Bacillus thuringiensis serovar kurstaki str. HD-1]AJK38472.1 putative lipoprotein [Bacillus thuringiensis serovar kurstaki]AUO31919.1 hypothetical protein [Bacillus thuringiensis serovar israelensis]EOP14296.1 hypothetical protein IGG_06663 [Bacillus cereus HuB13-1]EOP61478.1 hypothetical protein IGU_05838 [Bacillus cereus ISP2954]
MKKVLCVVKVLVIVAVVLCTAYEKKESYQISQKHEKPLLAKMVNPGGGVG